jgi:hypothetical protein
MNNESGTGGQGQGSKDATGGDKGPDDRREAAEKEWRDRWGVPSGTPEQGEKSADRVGGDGAEPAEPEIEDDDVEREGGRQAADDDKGDVERTKKV